MHYTRRDFLGSVSMTAAAGLVQPRQSPQGTDDPLGVRADFPAVKEGVYLNSPYITPSPVQAVAAAHAFLDRKARRPVSLGEMLEETDAVRRKFATLIGAREPEVGVLFATSEGENIVARALGLGAGDNVVIDDLHYDTTFVLYRHLAATTGLELRIVPSTEGVATPEAFAELVDDKTRLVSVSWVSHQNGYHHDLTALADLAHARGAYLYADAIQGMGMLSLDVKATGVDFLTSGTYKWLLGGFGVAPFFVREELLDVVKLDRFGALHVANESGDHHYDLYTDGRKFGYATLAFGAVYQLSAALDYLLRVGVSRIERHTVSLAHRMHRGLMDQGFALNTPPNNRSAIVSFVPGREGEWVKRSLEAAGVVASLREHGTQVRVGAALFNNAEDVDRFLDLTRTWS